MDSASFQFVVFGLTAAWVSSWSKRRLWRPGVLMSATLLFLAMVAPSPLQLAPMAGFLVLGYACLWLLQRGTSKASVWSILAVILAYVWVKKYTFLPSSSFINFPYLTLGLSYIFFRVLHLIIETNERSDRDPVSIGAYILYTLNFTTLVSGPIQRYEDFARDEFAEHPIPLGGGVIGVQLGRIVCGFFKVNVLAMVLHLIQEDALAQISLPVPLTNKLVAAFSLAVVYPFFLYANFSGYIDIVIALARLMRVRLPENFDRPFSASSFLDFWNRWHITLSTWLRTYVYNPLLLVLMRRVSSLSLQPFLGVLCFFITFFLVGVWHGRTSEFVIFGVLQGGGVAINKLWQLRLSKVLGRKGYKALASNRAYIAFGRGLTFSWFAFSLFWFWGSWNQIDRILNALSVVQWLGVWLLIWASATVVLWAWETLRAALLSIGTRARPLLLGRYAQVVYASALGLTAFVMTVLLNQPAPAIIYKAF